MQWHDRVYGRMRLDDPDLLALIECPTFRRLHGIRQAGPSAISFPFKNVTRYEHSLGVFALLRGLGADRKEQVAGLLHDVSHTAFSHAVDFVVTSDEQDHHETLKPRFLHRPDIVEALDRLGYAPADFHDDSRYPLLERPLPWLCADRLDYFLRDGMACQVVRRDDVARILGAVTVVDSTIVLDDPAAARLAARLFEVMNRDWWASDVEAYIYNEFAVALRAAIAAGALTEDELMLGEDDEVLARLDAAGLPEVDAVLGRLRRFDPSYAVGYVPMIAAKQRRIDPPVVVGEGFRPLSELLAEEA
jgi:HD superfamily phosphohydrolase